MIVFLIIILFLGIGMTTITYLYKEQEFPSLFMLIGIIFICSSSFCLGLAVEEEIAYKESLRGNNPYKMEIRYELQDSIYIPKDTIFTKIEK